MNRRWDGGWLGSSVDGWSVGSRAYWQEQLKLQRCAAVRSLLRAVQEEQRQFLSRHHGPISRNVRPGMVGGWACESAHVLTPERGSSSSPKTSSPRRATAYSRIARAENPNPASFPNCPQRTCARKNSLCSSESSSPRPRLLFSMWS